LQIYKGHTGAVTCMSTDTVGKILFTGSADSTVRSYNINSGQCLRVTGSRPGTDFTKLHFEI
jgi:WD40 repeat protein